VVGKGEESSTLAKSRDEPVFLAEKRELERIREVDRELKRLRRVMRSNQLSEPGIHLAVLIIMNQESRAE